jgi:hypothetical protein
MKKSRLPEIRNLLRQCDDGMATSSIAEYFGASQDVIRNSLIQMPDAYIDRWIQKRAARGQFEAVWCIVIPPENCPHPTEENE